MSILSHQSAINTLENFWDTAIPSNKTLAVNTQYAQSLNAGNTLLTNVYSGSFPTNGVITVIAYGWFQNKTAPSTECTYTIIVKEVQTGNQNQAYLSLRGGSTSGTASCVFTMPVSKGQIVNLQLIVNSTQANNFLRNGGWFAQYFPSA